MSSNNNNNNDNFVNTVSNYDMFELIEDDCKYNKNGNNVNLDGKGKLNQNNQCFKVVLETNTNKINDVYSAEIQDLLYSVRDEQTECNKYGSGSQILKKILKSLCRYKLHENFSVQLYDASSIKKIKEIDNNDDSTVSLQVDLAGFLLLKRNLTFYETFGFFYNIVDYEFEFNELLTILSEQLIIACRNNLSDINLNEFLTKTTEDTLQLLFTAYIWNTDTNVFKDINTNKYKFKKLLINCYNIKYYLEKYLEFFETETKTKLKLKFKDLINYGSFIKPPVLNNNNNLEEMNDFIYCRNSLIYFYKDLVKILDIIKIFGTLSLREKIDLNILYDAVECLNSEYCSFTIGAYKNDEMDFPKNYNKIIEYFLESGCILIDPEYIEVMKNKELQIPKISQTAQSVGGGESSNKINSSKSQEITIDEIFNEYKEKIINIYKEIDEIIDNNNFNFKRVTLKEKIKFLKTNKNKELFKKKNSTFITNVSANGNQKEKMKSNTIALAAGGGRYTKKRKQQNGKDIKLYKKKTRRNKKQ